MSTIYYPVRRKPAYPKPSLLEQVLLAAAGGLLIFILVSLGLFAGSRLLYAGRIFPGVSVSGVPVGGMTQRDASALIAERITYPQTGRIVLRDGARIWQAAPSELGLTLNTQDAARAAFAVGRSGTLFERVLHQVAAFSSGFDVAPVAVLDQRKLQITLDRIGAEVDQPAVDATLSLNGTEVVVTPGKGGRLLDRPTALALVTLQAQSLRDGILDLPIRDTAPVILDASAEADTARKILSAPLELHLPETDTRDKGPWTIDPGDLAAMLTIAKVEDGGAPRYEVNLRDDALTAYLAGLAPDLLRYPQNARFTFNDDTRLLEVIQPATIGRQLNVEASLISIKDHLRRGDHTIALEMIYNKPQITDDMTGQQLGITELVSSYTSYFRGSSKERIQNITAAASKFHGLLVAPGETFSMASAIGDITLDNGFAEALIIIGGQTIKGVGGGVCQVSTTLFRTAFFGGFPIVERHAHAYRVGYYEQTASGHDAALAGLDATVFVPLVDFKFTNDTPNWLLMETYVGKSTLTWKFYSTSDGRTVDWNSSGPVNITAPPDPIYRENADLSNGEIKQVDWAAEGADVTVNRTVYRNGSVYFSDSVITHYEAWADAYEYGPGTEIPPRPTPPPG